MKFDVATFNSLCLITFLCSALLTTALSSMFAQVAAFRFWAIAFYLLTASGACFALNLTWQHDVLLLATATLALQSRQLIWIGTRSLFGASTPWRAGLAVSAGFCLLYGCALHFSAPSALRAALLALFFLPCRAATLVEVCRRRRPEMGAARVLVIVGGCIVTLNTVVPMLLVMFDHANLSLLLGNPRSTSAAYAAVFAGDLLLTSGLIVLAMQRLRGERPMLATLERGARERVVEARDWHTARDMRRERSGHDAPAARQSLPGPV